MNRAQLRTLADERVRDARALLKARRWSAAYYLVGYAIECALKACVLAYVQKTGIIFQDRKYAEKCWTHDIEVLLMAADLKVARDIDVGVNPDLGSNWIIVKDWSEISRYQKKSESQARELCAAVTDTANGVLPWIKTRW